MRARLSEFDGKAVSLLGEAEAAHASDHGYIDSVIALSADPHGHISGGATWLLKSALEGGVRLSPTQESALCAGLAEISSWAAQLHLCQSIRYLDLIQDNVEQLACWCKPLLGNKRPFVRAWALDALFHLSKQHDVYRADFKTALAAAEQDEAASVRARARNLS